MRNLYLLFYRLATFSSCGSHLRGRRAVCVAACGVVFFGATQTLWGQCPAAGAVVITEVCVRGTNEAGYTSSCTNDPRREWFEIYNTTSSAINLNGWTVTDDNGSSSPTTITSNLMIQPNSFLVFGYDKDCFTLFTPNFGYFPANSGQSATTFDNCTDGVALSCGGNIITKFTWSNPQPSCTSGTITRGNTYTTVSVPNATNGVVSGTNINYGISGAGTSPTPGSAGVTLLPVEFTAFTAQVARGGAQLRWQTATESNNKGFFVQRSADGQRWQDLGFVAGHGDSYTTHDYAYLDEKPNTGTNYYRLLQMDHDGQTAYSAIAQVAFGTADSKGGARLFPVPANTRLTLSLDQTYSSPLTAFVFQTTGQLVATHTIAAEQQQLDMDVAHLPAGSYWVKIVGEQVVLPTLRWTK